MSFDQSAVLPELLALSHEFGEKGLVILGEGNTSCRVDEQTFFVKSSGSNLQTLTANQLTLCRFDQLLALMDRDDVSDTDVETCLLESRSHSAAFKPSVETFFHAYLLSLPDINFVGHTHPIQVNQILCSGLDRVFSENRQCPDEIVCCGPVSLLIPYVDPGLALAKRIRQDVEEFRRVHGKVPRVILLRNHGVITLGSSPQAVRAAMLMTVKAAEIFSGANSLGGLRHLPVSEIERIENRQDEEYRRKMLRI
jgi:rhamnose utilization protein RhaD (predicted bifunctional aldolase and dehydrogenase)